jgi:hypothetical protein
MVPLLAPVHAVANEGAPRSGRAVDADGFQSEATAVGELVADVPTWGGKPVILRARGAEGGAGVSEYFFRQKRLHDGDAEATGEMVVARPCSPYCLSSGSVSQGLHLRRRCHAGDRLDQIRHVRPRETVVAVPAVRLDDEHRSVDKPAEMGAGGRRGNSCLRCQVAGGERSPIAEGEKYPATTAVGEDLSNGSDVGISGHAASVGR